MTTIAPSVYLPKSLSLQSLQTLQHELQKAQHSGSNVPLVLQGQRDVFCMGLDLSFGSQGAQDAAPALALLGEIFAMLHDHKGVTVAVVTGTAAGGGAGLAAACDHVIATETATFALPEVLMGLTPATIAPFLVTRMGAGLTRRMMLDGASRDAAWAREAGLADQVCAVADLEKVLRQCLRRLGRGEADAVRGIRRLLGPTNLAQKLRDGQQETLERLQTTVVSQRVTRFNNGHAPWTED